MYEKIYEETKEKIAEKTGQYLKVLGVIDKNEKIKTGPPKKNRDIETILYNTGLIENTEEDQKIINEFYDYLILLGIDIGVGNGKKMIIESIQKNEEIYNQVLEINPEDLLEEIEPYFIDELRGAILNEK